MIGVELGTQGHTMIQPPVDLRSDTVTRPSPAMRAAMAEAEVGDDVYDEDPTINRLQERAAALFGKDAALFVPSGTMANLVAFLAQTRPGDAVIMASGAHPYLFESGNLAMVGGLTARLLEPQNGTLSPEAIAKLIDSGSDHHHTPTTLVAIENTYNTGGGVAYSVERVQAIAEMARGAGLRIHCDGARVFNGLLAEHTDAAQFGRHVDTISFCLSKGLGAPVGSLVLGDAAAIDRAHRFRKLLGGGMRQAGVLAAAGLFALEHHVDRLVDDHRRARAFRDAIAGMPGVALPLPCPTNLVYFDVPDAARLQHDLATRGVLVNGSGTRARAVFHLDIDDTGVDRAIDAMADAVRAAGW